MTQPWKQWEGQVVDGAFLLRQYLGGSENSAVFLTEYAEPEPRRAAIKLVLAEPGRAEIQLSRWEVAANLSHPHLIRLLRTGRCQVSDTALLYVLMEYAEENLSQVLPHRPLTAVEAREMLEPTLNALAYLHGQGLVHAHLKPANILAVEDHLKISSDGIHLSGESGGGSAKPGVYDPPEIATGGVSQAGDVWSLGLTLVEALTQRLPVWSGMDQRELVLPETIPAPFPDIARHCLRRDPRSRWTVADIAARLQPAAPATPGPVAVRQQKASPNWRYIVPATALGLAVLGILVGPRLLNRRREAPLAPSIQSEQDRSEKQAKVSGGRSIPGEVVHQVLPTVPRQASNTIRGTVKVRVRVRVDPSGAVVGAKLDSPGPSKYFAGLAVEAARRWEFAPPKMDDRAVSSEWVLRFEFVRTGTRVVPVRASP
ncbi:MAG: TonB family protein [Acidobacteria bacterium]|nr:TonB family protein [Acidobacteriota bacterium]